MKNLLLVALAGFVLVSCENRPADSDDTGTEGQLKVFAVNYPLLYFAERIGGDHIDLVYPIPGDVDPAYWVPSAALEDIQQADLILTNGAGYAKWMEKVSLPSSKIVNTSAAYADKYIEVEEGATHSHGAEGEHVHYGYAFTTWLDFKMALGQAEAVKDALSSKQPASKQVFEDNFHALKADLEALDRQMTETAARLPDMAIFASHPVYQYLARAYNLEIISEHWEPGENPSEEPWKAFTHKLDHHPANLMLWEGEPTKELKARLKQLNVETVLFNPCSNKPDEGDFISMMRQNMARLKQYISEFC